MLAMSSTSSSTNLGRGSSSWPSNSLLLEDPLITLLPNYQLHHLIQPTTTTLFPPPPSSSSSSPPPFLDVSATAEPEHQLKGSSTSSGGTTTTVKKLNHNASERHRRKKINTLYSSLRSLLPQSDHHPTKKVSIPITVSKVLKYIPTLQQEVETLVQKKKDLLSTIPNHNQDFDHCYNGDDDQGRSSNQKSSFSPSSSSLMSSSSTVSTSWISEEEVMVQVSIACDDNNNNIFPTSEILLHLQHSGFALLNSSSFECFHARVFYNFHLQVERSHGVEVVDSEALSEKLLRLYESKLGVIVHN